MYKNEANLNGELKVTPYGLNGKGAFFMKNAALRSPKFTFASRALDADSSNFTLTAGDVEGVSFATSNLASHIDFDTREGYFRSLVGGSKVDRITSYNVCYTKLLRIVVVLEMPLN